MTRSDRLSYSKSVPIPDDDPAAAVRTGPGAANDDTPARSARTRVLRVLGLVVAVLAVGFCVRTLLEQREVIGDALAEADLALLGAALVAEALAMVFLALAWSRCLQIFGVGHTRREATAWYFGGELGKYVPGGVWSVLGRGELAARAGVPRATTWMTTLLSYGVMSAAAAVVCGVFAPFIAVADPDLRWVVALVVLLPVGLLVVHPAVVSRLLTLAHRGSRGRLDLTAPAWRDMLVLLAWSVPTWLLMGFASSLVARALSFDQGVAQVVLATVVAWMVGFLAVPVPAGAGLREVVFIGLAGLALGPATAVAAVARVLLLVVDAAGGGLGLVYSQRRRPRRLVGATPGGGS